jgi:hypothetical protein
MTNIKKNIENEIEYEVLFDKVHIYKNLIKDPLGFVEVLKESENKPEKSPLFFDWQKWANFGTYMTSMIKILPEEEINISKEALKEKKYRDNIEKAFKDSVAHFLSKYGLSVDESWKTMGPSYCKYYSNLKLNSEEEPLAMVPHTDYQWYEFDSDRPKFAITCTIYLNDDYDGGELIFTVKGKDEKIKYKPKSGDVVVFPSGHPDLLSEDGLYYHAVGHISKKEKYFIRCFYLIPNKPSEKFLEYQKKYGKEEWLKMYDDIMQERIKSKIAKDLD